MQAAFCIIFLLKRVVKFEIKKIKGISEIKGYLLCLRSINQQCLFN
jgi:hypothetical protein